MRQIIMALRGPRGERCAALRTCEDDGGDPWGAATTEYAEMLGVSRSDVQIVGTHELEEGARIWHEQTVWEMAEALFRDAA